MHGQTQIKFVTSLVLHFLLSLSFTVPQSGTGKGFFWECFSFNQSVSFHQYSLHIFTYMSILLGQSAKPGNLVKSPLIQISGSTE